MLFSWLFPVISLLHSYSGYAPDKVFQVFMERFDREYAELGIRDTPFDYRSELQGIPGPNVITRQSAFFLEKQKELDDIDRSALTIQDQMHYDHLEYEITFNLQRLVLEKEFRTGSVVIPSTGLYTLPGWYPYRVKRYASVEITPEELFAFGKQEVKRVKEEIKRIQHQLGYANDSVGFYRKLASEEFILTDKATILQRYETIRSNVYSHLGSILRETDVARIEFMEWTGADRFTPPGYYSPADGNAVGIGVFHFNFYNDRHNVRSMEWLFLHEAVPGHHYQWWMRGRLSELPTFKRHFSYPGNFEGWAAYVEYFGKELGVYQDPYSELGKWEWDLVRSTRILIDVGIHHYGWTMEEAMTCWKKNIAGQDDIAEREVVRCLNWPGQALSYKVGAMKIQQMSEHLRRMHPQEYSIQDFHQAFLSAGSTPLAVIEKHISAMYAG